MTKDLDEIIIPGEPIYYACTLDTGFKNIELIPISDMHYGNPLFSKKHLMRTRDYILAEPYRFTILNGDLCESTIKTSRGEIFRQVGSPQDQRDWVIDTLYPLKDRILGMTIGNHEMRIYNEVGIDICSDIAKAFGVPYRPTGMWNKISFGSGNSGHKDKPFVYWTYFTHGYGGARTKSAKAVKVERLAHWLDADVYGMSHDHVVNVAPDVYLTADPRTHIEKDTGFRVGKIQAHRKMLVKTNAYLKWGGYSEMGGFPPVDLETPIIHLSGEGKRRIRVTI